MSHIRIGDRLVWFTGVLAVSTILVDVRAAVPDDLSTVEQRIISNLLNSVPSASTINGYRSSLSSNGSWSDIDYASTADVTWDPITHLTRLEAMAEAYSSSSSSLYHNTSLKTDILKAYDYWISRDPESSNWYHNEIAAPQALSDAMVLINGILSSSQRSAGLDRIERAYQPRSYNSGTNTGFNRVERAMAGISRGVIAGSNSITQDAFAAIGDTLEITSGSGMQRDGSFFQHGEQLYNSGYGSQFVSSVVDAIALNKGTDFAFSDTEAHVLIDHLLDGTQWMVRGQVIDYTASGRNITRKSQDDSASQLAGELKDILAAIPDYRTAELQAFQTRVKTANDTGSADPDLSLNGSKHFWQSDFTATQRPDFYTSVKISSTRTTQPEYGNGEGRKNLYLGDGVNLIMRTGNEYDNIMPVWNWRRLPGTTVEQDSRSLTQSTEFGVEGTSTFAGGVSDGKYSATTFRYDRFDVEARKSWFFFDKEFAALGVAINAPGATSDVNTTVNQTLLKGTISYKTNTSGTTKTLSLGNSVTPAGLQWVFHDGVGYFFPEAADNATIRSATQTGTWESINTRYDDTSVNKDVFTLYLNHGKQFTNGSYLYLVVPGLTPSQMDGYLTNNPVEVLKNTGTVQAVRQTQSDITQAAFYSAGSVAIADGQSIAVSNPSAIMLQRPTRSLQINASSPEAKSFALSIDLDGVKFASTGSSWLDGFGKSATFVLGLPEGTKAGATVGATITTDGAAKPTVQFVSTNQPTSYTYTSDAALNLSADTTLYAGSNKTLTFNGVIGGNASLTKSGESALKLNGQNTYTGGTYVVGGTVTVTGDQRGAEGGWAIGPANDAATTVTFNPGSRVRVAAGKTLQVGADSPTGTTQQLLNANGLLSNYGSLYVGRYANVQVKGTWSQVGDMTIAGKGDQAFSPIVAINNGGAFTYSGTSTIKIDPAPNSTASASLVIGNSTGPGTFTTSRGFERTIAGAGGTSILTLRYGGSLVVSEDVPELTRGIFQFSLGDGGGIIDTNSFYAGLSSPISNVTDSQGGLTKRGAGTLELFAGGSYRGATAVAAGLLKVSNTSGSATGSGAVTVASGAGFGGSGKIAGPVSIQSGARIEPGDVAGTLVTGDESWNGGGTYVFDITAVDSNSIAQQSTKGVAGGADWININGLLDIAATSSNRFLISIQSSNIAGSVLNWDATKSYTWILATATDSLLNFASSKFAVDVSSFLTANQTTGNWTVTRSGDDLLLNYTATSVVPEPGNMIAITSSLLMLASRRRRNVC